MVKIKQSEQNKISRAEKIGVIGTKLGLTLLQIQSNLKIVSTSGQSKSIFSTLLMLVANNFLQLSVSFFTLSTAYSIGSYSPFLFSSFPLYNNKIRKSSMNQEQDVRQWFDIIYPQPDPNRLDDPYKDLLWTRKNIQKYINFIEQYQELFLTQERKRKCKAFTIAAEFMGPPFKNITMRRRFDAWFKKYSSLDNMIVKVKRNIWLSIRNQKIFAEVASKVRTQNSQQQLDKQEQVSMAHQKSINSEQSQFFFISNGVISFKDQGKGEQTI